ncbi:MAG: hypothetical protein NC548_38735 [Lachnospiraceae bacterium]|nr:hypothetical protein [Lachnospiraceae bacterium]
MACKKELEVYVMTVTLLGYTLNFLSVIGILSVLVTIITEMIKNLGPIRRIPTKLTALLISFAVISGAMAAYLNLAGEGFVWWYLIAAFFAAFIVGYLSMNGWDALSVWN